MKPTLIRTTAWALALSTAAAFPAQADFTAQEVFDAVTGALVQNGLNVGAETVTLDGDDVIITDLSVGDAGDAAVLPRAELRNIMEVQDGVFEIGEVYIPGQSITTPDGIDVTYGDVSVNELKVASIESGYTELDNGFYTAASIDGIAINDEEQTVFSADALNVTVTPYEASKPVSSSVTIDKVIFNTETLADARARQTMKALGYEQVRGDMVMNAIWDPANDGRLALTDVTLSAEDAADLTLTLDVGGYTTEVVEAMRELQAQMEPGNEQASGMAMLGMLQQLEFKSMSLKLKDESLTGRLLDFVAAQQGMNRESVTAMALGFLPLGLAQLQSPEFAANAQQAISEYLNDPDTLTISAEPAEPVPFALLMGPVLSGNPQSLLQTLNVTMSAN